MVKSGERTRHRVQVVAPSPKHALPSSTEQEKFAMARAPSAARQARALPGPGTIHFQTTAESLDQEGE